MTLEEFKQQFVDAECDEKRLVILSGLIEEAYDCKNELTELKAKIKELKDKARRQGYAIACQYLKKDENGLTAFDRKELQKALTVLEWLDSKRIDMHNAWKDQREIARQLRELTYKYNLLTS